MAEESEKSNTQSLLKLVAEKDKEIEKLKEKIELLTVVSKFVLLFIYYFLSYQKKIRYSILRVGECWLYKNCKHQQALVEHPLIIDR